MSRILSTKNLIIPLIFFASLTFQLPINDSNNIPISENSLSIMSNVKSGTDNDLSDILILFKGDIPDIVGLNRHIIKKYTNFPVLRMNFGSATQFQTFYQRYGKFISKIELNRIIPSSLDNTPDSNLMNKISRAMIQDSVGASYLINQLGITGNRTKIGIIDTGVSHHSLEFGSRLKERGVFVTKDNHYSQDISEVEDNHGHGTHIAGLAAGATTGIAPEAEIYSAKIVEPGVAGTGGGIMEETTAGLLDSIDFLVNNSVDVINISLGQYHNLANGLRDEVINYVSQIHNVVFSISIGNSGTNYGDRATLNNPGTALQCIAVTATNIEETSIANYASRGPKVDYSLKPDITAPGTSLDGPSHTGSGTVRKTGTSMATPIVGGAAALLIDYLKKNMINYTAGTIKAALLAGTQSLGEPIWEEGAGFLNVTRSWEILNSSILNNNSPDIGYLHPSKLPFDPYKVLFTGSSVEFNLTVITSISRTIKLNVSNNLKEFMSIHDEDFLINNSCILPINFSIPETSTPQYVSGNITLGELILDVEFEIRKPIAHILFDESLNKIVRHGYTTDVYEIQGDSSNTIGMYSKFTQYLAYDKNYSVTPHVSGDLTLSKLSNFDVLILANPFSLSTDIYMDWVSDPGNEYVSISETSKNAISQYVALGGSILIFNTIDPYLNISAINEITSLFDIQIQTELSFSVRISEITKNTLNFTDSIDSFPFRGNYLNSSANTTQIIAEYDGNPTIIAYEGPTGGRVLVFGSDLIFDNIGLSNHAYSGNPEQNHVLAFNSVSWLAQGEYKETSPTTNIPEFPFQLVFLTLILALGVIYYLFILKKRH